MTVIKHAKVSENLRKFNFKVVLRRFFSWRNCPFLTWTELGGFTSHSSVEGAGATVAAAAAVIATPAAPSHNLAFPGRAQEFQICNGKFAKNPRFSSGNAAKSTYLILNYGKFEIRRIPAKFRQNSGKISSKFCRKIAKFIEKREWNEIFFSFRQKCWRFSVEIVRSERCKGMQIL